MSMLNDSLKQRIQQSSALFSVLDPSELDALLGIARTTEVPADYVETIRGTTDVEPPALILNSLPRPARSAAIPPA